MAASIKVQRGTVDAADGSSGETYTSFTEVGALTAVFESNSNNRLTHGGSVTSTGNQDANEMSGGLQLTATDTLSLYRISTANTGDARFAWELVEYIGAEGGDNEFIVRSRNTFVWSPGSGDPTAQALDTTPTNTDRCIPIITGLMNIQNSGTSTGLTAVAWINDSGTLEVSGGAGTGTSTVFVTVVEFTGSNWEVYHASASGQSADTGTLTLNTDSDGAGGSEGDVTDWGTALIFGQSKGDDDTFDDAVSDTNPLFTPGSDTTEVDWEFDSAHDGDDNHHFVHVLRHPDMSVTRFTSTNADEGAANLDITSAGLTDITQAMVVGFTITDGTSDSYGQGWKNFRLTSTTNCEMWVHRSGGTVSTNVQVADFTGVVEGSAPTFNAVLNLTLLGVG